MPIRSGGTAPYAPPLTVLHVINQFRERGLTTPITEAVLLKASVSESLAPRTLAALKGLDLISDDGHPTAEMEGLRRAKTDEYAPRLEAIIRSVYAEVFQYADPAKDDATKIADAFRDFEPAGQRTRMVTLFLGLCAEARIVPESVLKKQSARTTGKATGARRASAGSVSRDVGKANGGTAAATTGGLDPVLVGVLQRLPKDGKSWTQGERDNWLRFFTTNLDFVIPVGEPSAGTTAGDQE